MRWAGVALLLAGCGGATGSSSLSEGLTATHDQYSCAATISDKAETDACIADFQRGTGSDCVWTCNSGTCQIVRALGGGYESVATCVAP